MPPWNVVLQLEVSGTPARICTTCRRYSLPGIARPCRIVIVACDTVATPSAIAAHDLMDTELRSRAAETDRCHGPGIWECIAWNETSCRQILIPVIGQPVSIDSREYIEQWQRRAGSLGVVAPALITKTKLRHAEAFAGCPPAISRLNRAAWQDNPGTLAAAGLRIALHDERPQLFVSYRREEATPLADQTLR